MKGFRLILQIMLLLAVTAGVSACSKDKKSSVNRGMRGGVGGIGGIGGSGGTTGIAPTYNGHNSPGEITQFHRYSLLNFLRMSDQQVGDVSMMSNQTTGVRFDGRFDTRGFGSVVVWVYDSIANQGGGYLENYFQNCQAMNLGASYMGTHIQVNCRDGVGDLTFDGYESAAYEYAGKVYYDGGVYLGEFRISSCRFFGCQ